MPASSDGAALGSASAEWSDVYVADAGVINLGDDQDVTITHVADTGVLLNGSKQFQFGDSGTKISQSTDGQLDIDADTEVEIAGTTIDMNGNVDISGSTTFNDKILVNSSAVDGGDGVAIPLTNYATYIITGGAEASTLAAGTEGQIKVIVMETDGGDMVITVSNAGWNSGGSGTITFNDAGDGCTLQYIDSKWYCIGANGITFGT